MSVILPYSFVPGTIAKANEVNKNFEVLRNAANASESSIEELQDTTENLQNNKANKNGNTNEVFKCANAVNDHDAINKQSLDNAISNTIDYISGLSIVKDGNYSIIVSSGSCYDTTHSKILKLSNSISKDNVDQIANTTYYVYIIGSSNNMNVDIVISTSSVSPSYPSSDYNLYRQIGKFTTNNNNSIDSIFYYGMSQNGIVSFGLASELFNLLSPDYTKTITTLTLDKNGTLQSWTAPYCGWLMNNTLSNLNINGSADSSANVYGIIAFLNKGDTIYSTSTTAATYHFLQCKGVE